LPHNPVRMVQPNKKGWKIMLHVKKKNEGCHQLQNSLYLRIAHKVLVNRLVSRGTNGCTSRIYNSRQHGESNEHFDSTKTWGGVQTLTPTLTLK
jgi:hypothetical protein